MRGLWAAVMTVAGMGVTSPSARAQAAPTASELFARGDAAMSAKEYAVACPMFDESYALDPGLLGTLFTAADCYRDARSVHTALIRYKSYVAAIERLPESERKRRDRGRLPFARDNIASLTPLVPTLALASKAPPGAVVVLDGTALEPAQIEQPIPVDPGPHSLLVRWANGGAPEERAREVTLKVSEHATLDLDWAVPAPHNPSPSTDRVASDPVSVHATAAAATPVDALGEPGIQLPTRGLPAWSIGLHGLIGTLLGSAEHASEYGPGVSVRGGVTLDVPVYLGIDVDVFSGDENGTLVQPMAVVGYEFAWHPVALRPSLGLGLSTTTGQHEAVVSPNLEVLFDVGALRLVTGVRYNALLWTDDPSDGIVVAVGLDMNLGL